MYVFLHFRFVDFFIIATHNLVDISEQGYTYHPSRLMGTDDLLNAVRND